MADNYVANAGSGGNTFASDDISSVHYARVKLSLGADGTAVDAVAGAGAVTTGTQRVTLASDDPLVAAVNGGREYETVAASATAQALGATGAVGDVLVGLICIVSTAATSQVQIKDGSDGAITILPNNVGGGVGTYPLPVGLTSRTGAWQITTAAGVAVIAIGDFT